MKISENLEQLIKNNMGYGKSIEEYRDYLIGL